VGLYEQIGRLKMELEWLKEKLLDAVETKRTMIELAFPHISIRRQCELIGLNRATFYCAPAMEPAFTLQLMHLIDEQYTKTPFYGWPRMAAHLQRLGLQVNHKRVQRLMQTMRLQAIYPKPRTSSAASDPKIYPYLLGAVAMTRPYQVWSVDITYVRMSEGFVYLVVILDWFSRYVLSWQLSNTLDPASCLAALDIALEDGKPEIFNTDQGVQFTSLAFTSRLERAGIAISMDGRGRALDNIFVERLWRTVKHEDIYLKDYATVPALEEGLASYFQFYSHERRHQTLA
jgi:putative transposase